MIPEKWLALARKRIQSVLRRHGIAVARTLEHKIADGGPFNQRINPHILSPARQSLVADGLVLEHVAYGSTWYFLPEIDPTHIETRLAHQGPILEAVGAHALTTRVGQALEIAVDRGLGAIGVDYFGGYADLDEHDDATLYSKDGPPSRVGTKSLPNTQKVDFLLRPPGTDVWAGIEVKNVRAWLYPTNVEIVTFLRKTVTLDVVPVLIARRIPFVTGRLLRRCGVLTWETLRQRYPLSELTLAASASHKLGLGYADITLGNHCDPPLAAFLGKLPNLAAEAAPRFASFRDLVAAYSFGDMTYDEFAARVRRRDDGTNEDFDEDTEIPF